jgi:hypothetical protein
MPAFSGEPLTSVQSLCVRDCAYALTLYKRRWGLGLLLVGGMCAPEYQGSGGCWNLEIRNDRDPIANEGRDGRPILGLMSRKSLLKLTTCGYRIVKDGVRRRLTLVETQLLFLDWE